MAAGSIVAYAGGSALYGLIGARGLFLTAAVALALACLALAARLGRTAPAGRAS